MNNCVYNWAGDRKKVKFMTVDAVKSVTTHEVINSNETGNLYGEDVEDLRKGYLEVNGEMAGLVGRLAKL